MSPAPTPTTTPLGRQATGLARFYMDCGWWRHPRFTGLAPDALVLLMAIVSHGYEHGTDGLAPAEPEDLAAALGLRVSVVRKGLGPLLERGSLIPVSDPNRDPMVAVRDWADHNPTASEVAGYRKERARSGTIGNHNRWHRDKGRNEKDCPYCDHSTDPNTDRSSDPPSDGSAIANGSHGMGWDGSTTENVVSPTGRDPAPDPDDDKLQQTLEQAATLIGQHRAKQPGVHNPGPFALAAAAAIFTDPKDAAVLAEMRDLASAGLTAANIAAAINSTPNGQPPDDRPHEPSARELYEAAEALRRQRDAEAGPPADPATAKALAAQAKAAMHPRSTTASHQQLHPGGQPE